MLMRDENYCEQCTSFSEAVSIEIRYVGVNNTHRKGESLVA